MGAARGVDARGLQRSVGEVGRPLVEQVMTLAPDGASLKAPAVPEPCTRPATTSERYGAPAVDDLSGPAGGITPG
jgi:hypothetical protein